MVEVNKYGVNMEIKGHILAEDIMKQAGFTDRYYEGTVREQDAKCWHMHKFVKFPNEKCYRNFEVTFYVKIPKDGTDISIEVIDEDFMQPYDYQYILHLTPEHRAANIVKEQVEQWMQQLSDFGIITGFQPGMYI